jgi:hypothetical protein
VCLTYKKKERKTKNTNLPKPALTVEAKLFETELQKLLSPNTNFDSISILGYYPTLEYENKIINITIQGKTEKFKITKVEPDKKTINTLEKCVILTIQKMAVQQTSEEEKMQDIIETQEMGNNYDR